MRWAVGEFVFGCRTAGYGWIAAIVATGLVIVTAGLAEDETARQQEEAPISDFEREHWAFRPLQRPPLPDVSDPGWCETGLDRFILRRLDEREVAPLGRAPGRVLARRLAFDLTGLPPSHEQIVEFETDTRPDAWDRFVDRSLASPHYGERWAQHWLDVSRFAETDGFEHDKVRPDAWRFRDWVIEAFNSDLPVDQFIRLQVAGDLPGIRAVPQPVATAFCLAGPDMPDVNLQEERRHFLLNEITSTVGEVFLGLQLACAQCHDHKYDPLTQGDFYRLRAFFENAVAVARDKSVGVLSERAEAEPESYIYARGDWRRPAARVLPAVPRIAVGEEAFVDKATRLHLAQWLTRSDNRLVARVMANRIQAGHFGQGLTRTPSDLGVMGDTPSHAELLDWLAVELTGWGRSAQGEAEDLASSRAWSFKRMHRLLLLSATFRRTSHPEPGDPEEMLRWRALCQKDPENRLLGRASRRRLEGEAIRDAMLVASGGWNSARGGPGVFAPLPPELTNTLLKNQWPPEARAAENVRRSIYIFARRNLRYPLFEVFDRPDANASCPRRPRSTTPLQAMTLLNSDFTWETAGRCAERVLREAGTDRVSGILLLYRTVLGREPFAAEQNQAIDYLAAHQTDTTPQERLTVLAVALFNSHEFVYVE